MVKVCYKMVSQEILFNLLMALHNKDRGAARGAMRALEDLLFADHAYPEVHKVHVHFMKSTDTEALTVCRVVRDKRDCVMCQGSGRIPTRDNLVGGYLSCVTCGGSGCIR